MDPNASVTGRIATVAATRGLVAFWHFRSGAAGPWASLHDPQAIGRSFPLRLRRIGDPVAYAPVDWPGRGVEDRLELRPEGPFGSALRCNQGHIYGEVARSDFAGTALDLHGRRPFTLMAWTSFIGERHLIAGIWDEGGWDRYGGRRQAALFAGLFGSHGVIAHLSATGAASFPQSNVPGAQYARIKAIDGRAFADRTWICAAMTFDGSGQFDAWLDGVRTPRSYRDDVAAQVFADSAPRPVNPAAFAHPIWSPRAFLLKFNGYDRSSGIAEHWLRLDLDAGTAVYGRTPQLAGRWRISLDLLREGASLLAAPLRWQAQPERTEPVPELSQARPGDVLLANFEQAEGDAWRVVGTPIRRAISEGAPFTVGRALGLGSEEVRHGSQLLLGGVAVFDRVLGADELAELSFAERR